MSAEHRGGSGRGELFYSMYRRQFSTAPARMTDANPRRDIRAQSLAPALDLDVVLHDDCDHQAVPSSGAQFSLYDGQKVVALFDVKLQERWALTIPSGLPAMASMANDHGAPAFVLTCVPERLTFTYWALNNQAQLALMAMQQWAAIRGQRLEMCSEQFAPGDDSEKTPLMTWQAHEAGHWHFEMLLRSRRRGKEWHDEQLVAEVDRRLSVLRKSVPLPQPDDAEPFAYIGEAIRQRPHTQTTTLEPITFQPVASSPFAAALAVWRPASLAAELQATLSSIRLNTLLQARQAAARMTAACRLAPL